jgi:hypothetical protein
MAQVIRVCVTGAAGQIAYSLLPHICLGRTFGPDKRVILHLLDIERAQTVRARCSRAWHRARRRTRGALPGLPPRSPPSSCSPARRRTERPAPLERALRRTSRPHLQAGQTPRGPRSGARNTAKMRVRAGIHRSADASFPALTRPFPVSVLRCALGALMHPPTCRRWAASRWSLRTAASTFLPASSSPRTPWLPSQTSTSSLGLVSC